MTKRTTHEDSGHPVGRVDREALEGDEPEAPGSRDKRFQALIENSADVITLTTADGTILYESPSVERVSGYAPEERMGTSFFDLIHPDDRPTASDNLAQILDKPGASASMELRFRHRNGSWVHVEGIGKNLLQNPDVQAVVCNYRDVTKHKMLEEELRKYRGDLEALVEERTAKLRADIAERGRVEKALRESEEKLNEALRIGRMGSWEYDIESQEVAWSEQLFELMDRDPSLGTPDSAVDLASYYPQDMERLVELLEKVINGHGSTSSTLSSRLSMRHKLHRRGFRGDERRPVTTWISRHQSFPDRKIFCEPTGRSWWVIPSHRRFMQGRRTGCRPQARG